MTHHLHTVDAEDADLVAAALAGDAAAFSGLFRRHAPRVAGVCRKRVPGRDVDDMVQEAFAQAFTHLDSLDDPAAFGPWIRTIAVRACADAGRSRRRDVLTDTVSETDPTQATPDEVVVARSEADHVAGSLAELGERDRRALWMRDALEYSVPEVARQMGTTVGSTRVLLTRARKRLRATIVAAAAGILGLRALGRQQLGAMADAIPAGASLAAVQIAVVIGAIVVAPGTATREAVESATGPAPAVPAVSPIAISDPIASTPTPAAAPDPAVSRPASAAADPRPQTKIDRSGDAVIQVETRPEPDEGDGDIVLATGDSDGESAALTVFTGDTVTDLLGWSADNGSDGSADGGDSSGSDASTSADNGNDPQRLCVLGCPSS